MSEEKEYKYDSLPKPPRTWLTLLMGGVLLMSGIVIGVGGTVVFVQNNFQRPDGPPDRFNDRVVSRLTQDLGLTPDQEQEIRAIFKENHETFKEIHGRVRKEVEGEFQNLRARVEEVLTPEQAKIWNERFQKLRQRSRMGRPGRGHEPPPRHRDRDSVGGSGEQLAPVGQDGFRNGRPRHQLGDQDEFGNRRPQRRPDGEVLDGRPRPPDGEGEFGNNQPPPPGSEIPGPPIQ